MIGVVAVSHYFRPLTEAADLPSLETDLKVLCREPFRRIDRFVQLALVGSGRCTRAHMLRPDCAVYLGSGLGPIGNNITVQQQLVRDHELPKPFNFVNTLGSSAGFYVTRNLGLRGRNLFISRRGASFAAVLSAALADLTLGVTLQALVGVVEEVTLPLAEHRRRQHWPDKAVPAEGSHWWLLQAGAHADSSLEMQRFAEFSELTSQLQSMWHSDACLICARDMESREAVELRTGFAGVAPIAVSGAVHDSLEAAQVAEICAGNQRSDVFLVNGDAECGWMLFHFRP